MESETFPAVVVIETVEITTTATDRPDIQHRSAGGASRMRGADLTRYAAEHPALVTIAGAMLGYSLVRFFSRLASETAPFAMTRRVAVLRGRPARDAEASGDGLKRHGDKYASAFESFTQTRAPTYPEG